MSLRISSRPAGVLNLAALFVLLLAASPAVAGPYDAPAGYYSSATGTGATLESQLETIMSTGHIQRSYGDFRYASAIIDRDPNNANNILLVYNRASVPATWDSGRTWNREHVWPQSRQPGSASNSTRGNLGDPHALRPANPSINSNRGNDPFGTAASTGSYGGVGSYYFPGDEDKGDIARQLFYSDTRWASKGISLVHGLPGGNQMGDLGALLVWHYSDAPDEFESRRNHAIYSSDLNPQYYTNNRNAYIDRPEYVWSVFVDQANDTRLSLAGAAVGGDGSSSLAVDLGRVYVGGAAPTGQSVTLNKTGDDGVYYGVSTTGAATSTGVDTYNAFEMNTIGSDQLMVGLDASTATSGLVTGAVTIDNLDVTTGGGAGRGANDADDVIDLSFAVLDHPIASLAGDAIATSALIDFGSVAIGSGVIEATLDLFNYDGAGAPSFASLLDLDSILGSGDTGVLTTDLSASSGLAQGGSLGFDVMLDTSGVGDFSATYELTLSGEDLPGEQQQTLMLTLMGEVTAAPLPGDYNDDGTVDAADYTVWRDTLGSTVDLAADGDGSGEIDAGDYTVWTGQYGTSSSVSAAVPEPSALLLAAIALAAMARRRP